MSLKSLPIELVADIISNLDVVSLITVSQVSQQLRQICSDPQINPWRRPILQNLLSGAYEPCLAHLAMSSIVPRQNWLDILVMANPEYLLLEATLPSLKSSEWQEIFSRRFLPSWKKWKKEGGWREAYMRILYRMWHRGTSWCTSDEAWTKYIILNRNGSVNLVETSSRGFNPIVMFNEMKTQANLETFPTTVKVLVEFRDVRILAFGVVNYPMSSFYRNHNAHMLLSPPDLLPVEGAAGKNIAGIDSVYKRLIHPLPVEGFSEYPQFTPGVDDLRWNGDLSETGTGWVGHMLLVAQLIGPNTKTPVPNFPIPDVNGDGIIFGPGRGQFASFTWEDLVTIAPWMEKAFTRIIDGPGLGL